MEAEYAELKATTASGAAKPRIDFSSMVDSVAGQMAANTKIHATYNEGLSLATTEKLINTLNSNSQLSSFLEKLDKATMEMFKITTSIIRTCGIEGEQATLAVLRFVQLQHDANELLSPKVLESPLNTLEVVTLMNGDRDISCTANMLKKLALSMKVGINLRPKYDTLAPMYIYIYFFFYFFLRVLRPSRFVFIPRIYYF